MSAYEIFVNPGAADALPLQYARVSLPLARGAFGQPAVSVVDAQGNTTACQSEVLTRWPDGSARMVHLVFQGRGGVYEARVEDGGDAPAVTTGISLEERDGVVMVTNGRLWAELGGAGLVQSIRLGEREMIGPAGIEVRVADEAGRIFAATAARDVTTTVETAGALRSVVTVRGKCTLGSETFLHFRLRFEFLAGVEGFSLAYNFVNLETGADFWAVNSMELALRLADAGRTRFSVCQSEHGLFGQPRLVTTEQPLHIVVDNTLVHPHVANYEALEDDTVYPFYMDPPADRIAPWCALSGDAGSVTVEMDDFALLRPKTLDTASDTLVFGVWPAEAGLMELQQGRSREVTVRVAFSEGGAPEALDEPAQRIAQLRDVWRAQLRHGVYAEREFFDQGRVLPYSPLEHPRFERWLGGISHNVNSVATFFDLGDGTDYGYRRTYMPLGRQRRIRGEDGGPRWFSTSYQNPAIEMNDLEDFEPVWVNNEYDIIFAFGTEFLRTGDLSLFQKLRWFSRHNIEVDFLHRSDHKWLHRATPAHSARHTTTGAYPSHFWTQGLAQYYMLTGDPDALEVVIALADKTIENLDDPEIGKLVSGLNREVGWGILTLVCAYEASGEKRFDDYARKLLDGVRALGLPHDIPIFSFGHTSLILAVRQYLQVHGDDETAELREWFLAFIDVAVRCMTEAPPASATAGKTAGTYSYDAVLAMRGKLNADARDGILDAASMALDSLAYAYEISGDEKYIQAGKRSLEAMVDSTVFPGGVLEAKLFAMYYRTWINYFKFAAEKGYLDKYEYERV